MVSRDVNRSTWKMSGICFRTVNFFEDKYPFITFRHWHNETVSLYFHFFCIQEVIQIVFWTFRLHKQSFKSEDMTMEWGNKSHRLAHSTCEQCRLLNGHVSTMNSPGDYDNSYFIDRVSPFTLVRIGTAYLTYFLVTIQFASIFYPYHHCWFANITKNKRKKRAKKKIATPYIEWLSNRFRNAK